MNYELNSQVAGGKVLLVLILLATRVCTPVPAPAQQASAFIIQNSEFSMARSAPSDVLLRLSLAPDTRPLVPKVGRDFWALVGVQTGLTIWDTELSQHRFRQGWTEDNPFLGRRPSRARMYATFFGVNLAADYAAWRLRRAGHRHWARIVQIASMAGYGYGVQHNTWHPGRHRAPPAPPPRLLP